MSDMIPAATAASELGVAYQDLRKLVASGVLYSEPKGTSTLYRAEEIQDLKNREHVSTNPSAAIAVRMGVPTEIKETELDYDWRQWRGWNTQWEDDRKRKACQAWWGIAPEYREENRALVVLVSHWVVDVFTIEGDGTPPGTPGGATKLNLKKETLLSHTKEFANKQLRLKPGPLATPSEKWKRSSPTK